LRPISSFGEYITQLFSGAFSLLRFFDGKEMKKKLTAKYAEFRRRKKDIFGGLRNMHRPLAIAAPKPTFQQNKAIPPKV